ncbi:hypothetical protein C3B44_03905 [Corynebacterium yudongzhengii]|uniref:Uncharacterized protein n=1 Tax=Corynebacterium yudongzhengii TaxID=2080740 RepID=A0A2U1T6H5_9CORY|nr:hypothetical protein [Corynebacterium yudongzhengii]AWB81611.1 hypothetical protein C3B44_03905 [Corynebacterium yudongzhengii]PWC01596.1 hypothetical protein DF222_06565 [Corynebacterium yudongzhengii]
MLEIATLAQETSPVSHWPIWGLFLLAGLLVGGTWSAYQNSSKVMTIILGLLAALATVVALALLIQEMG